MGNFDSYAGVAFGNSKICSFSNGIILIMCFAVLILLFSHCQIGRLLHEHLMDKFSDGNLTLIAVAVIVSNYCCYK